MAGLPERTVLKCVADHVILNYRYSLLIKEETEDLFVHVDNFVTKTNSVFVRLEDFKEALDTLLAKQEE